MIKFSEPHEAELDVIQEAGELLRAGELVAFATETVYGLGANALDEAAVQKIFSTKGRPSDNPLIVHLANAQKVNEYVSHISDEAEELMNAFWPGPLTLVFEMKPQALPSVVTAGLPTVAIRVPSHETARAIITAADRPIVAPSANISSRPSPTVARHVFDDLQGKIPLIIDSGSSNIGVESTVVDVSGETPVILRFGAITEEMIEDVVKDFTVKTTAADAPKAPGMKYKHYSPKAKVMIVKDLEEAEKLKSEQQQLRSIILNYRSTEQMAQRLFHDFRDADKKGIELIIVLSVEEKGLGMAVMDRLRKAAASSV